ncbi:DUF1800 family protein, partial [Burkholderia pseudomallei]|uniref:DUF1800 family protein n=1 Tax=Burkholderia pseudomallei TaxID=28450 RepID=UPI00387B0657
MTLGEGHYTQHDVSEAARPSNACGPDPHALTYVFRPNVHDTVEKTVLGESGRSARHHNLHTRLGLPATVRLLRSTLSPSIVSVSRVRPDRQAASARRPVLRPRARANPLRPGLRDLLRHAHVCVSRLGLPLAGLSLPPANCPQTLCAASHRSPI